MTDWRNQAAPDGDEGTEPVSEAPETDDGDYAQVEEELQEAWRELGEAYGAIYKTLEAAAAAFVDGYKDTAMDPVDRAIAEWHLYLRSLPWWKRWALKLWYSL